MCSKSVIVSFFLSALFHKLHCYVILVLFRDKIDLQLVGSVEEGNGDLSEFQVFHKISEKLT